MPLKSRAQAAYLEHNEPDVYKEFAAATPKGAKLPYKVGGATSTKPAMKRQKVMAASLRTGTLD